MRIGHSVWSKSKIVTGAQTLPVVIKGSVLFELLLTDVDDDLVAFNTGFFKIQANQPVGHIEKPAELDNQLFDLSVSSDDDVLDLPDQFIALAVNIAVDQFACRGKLGIILSTRDR